MMHGNLTAIETELEVENVATNRGGAGGGGPGHIPKKFGLDKSRLLGGLAGT